MIFEFDIKLYFAVVKKSNVCDGDRLIIYLLDGIKYVIIYLYK